MLATLILFLTVLTPPDEPHWRILKKYVQQDVQVVQVSDSLLLLYHTERNDTLRVGLRPCSSCDISGFVERRRGSNPYRVWVASPEFWTNPSRPRSTWGAYFRASFLRILRPPDGPDAATRSD